MGSGDIIVSGKRKGFQYIPASAELPVPIEVSAEKTTRPKIFLIDDSPSWGLLCLASSLKQEGVADVSLEFTEDIGSSTDRLRLSRDVIAMWDRSRHGIKTPKDHVKHYASHERLWQQEGRRIRAHIPDVIRQRGELYGSVFEELGVDNPDLEDKIIRYNINPEFLRKLVAEKPDVVGLTVYSFSIEAARDYVEIIKALSDSLVVVGGPAVIMSPMHALVHTGADIALAGQAEFTLPQVASILHGHKKGQPLSEDEKNLLLSVGGCYFIDGDKVVSSKRRFPRLTEAQLNDFYVDHTLLGGKLGKTSSVSINTSRGCQNNCPWCCKIHGSVWRGWTAKRLLEEVERVAKSIDIGLLPKSVDTIDISDDDFFQNRERALEFFRMFKESGFSERFQLSLQGTVSSFFRDDKLDVDLIEGMRGIRIMDISVGTENFCDAELQRLQKARTKPYTVDMVKQLVKKLDEEGILQFHYLILSNLDTRPIDMYDNLRTIMDLLQYKTFQVNYANPYLLVIPGTELEKEVKRRGLDGQIGDTVLSKKGFREYDYKTPGRAYPLDPVVRETIEKVDADIGLQRRLSDYWKPYYESDSPAYPEFEFFYMQNLFNIVKALRVAARREYKHTKDPERREEMAELLRRMEQDLGYRFKEKR